MKHRNPQPTTRTDEARAQARRMAAQAETADPSTARQLLRAASDVLRTQIAACENAGRTKTADRLTAESLILWSRYLALR